MATDRALVANADTAQELAPALLRFQSHVPEVATELAALASELYGISSALLELRTACIDPRNVLDRLSIEDEKRIVLRSLEYTFRDLDRFIRKTEDSSYRTDREAFTDVWAQIESYFRRESNNSLLVRLRYYKDFIDHLIPIVEGEPAYPEVDDLYDRIDGLLRRQDERLAEDLDNLAVGAPRVPSFERVRPPLGVNTPTSPPPLRRRSPRSPQSPGGGDFPPRAPYVPDPPYSPSSRTTDTGSRTSTAADTASTPPSSAGSGMNDHWLKVVFAQSRPTTNFTISGSKSVCYGEKFSGSTQALRKQKYEELLSLPFDEVVETKLFSREEDRKSRIFCRFERAGDRFVACQPVTNFKIIRKDSCLQLCKPERNRLILWANLRFASYERLILFFCSLLALKALDEANPISRLDDHLLKDEICVFSCVIIDDDYRHALQIFKDKNSNGMRLLASVVRGPLKRCPVWTAFINYRVASVKWCHQAESRKVHLGDLQRYVFSPDYVAQQGPNGVEEIIFVEAKDAEEFIKVIKDLAKLPTKPPPKPPPD